MLWPRCRDPVCWWWSPTWSDRQRTDGYAGWRKAVERTLDWVDVDEG
jgi:glycerol kinase